MSANEDGSVAFESLDLVLSSTPTNRERSCQLLPSVHLIFQCFSGSLGELFWILEDIEQGESFADKHEDLSMQQFGKFADGLMMRCSPSSGTKFASTALTTTAQF